jgi:hypothetical protein
VDEFDADRVVNRTVDVAVQDFTHQHGYRRTDALAAGQRHVVDLLAEFAWFDVVKDVLQALFDAPPSTVQILHRSGIGVCPARE